MTTERNKTWTPCTRGWCSSTHLIWHILSELVGSVLRPLVSSLSFSPFRPLLRLLTLVLDRRGLLLRRCLASDRFLSSRGIRWWFRAEKWRIGVFQVGVLEVLDFGHTLVSSFLILLFELDGFMPREVLEVLGMYIGIAATILPVRLRRFITCKTTDSVCVSGVL